MGNTAKRQVHFLPRDTVFEIANREDYTKREILACWYTKSQLEKVATKRWKAALEWEAAESSSVYIRGLEHYTTEGEKRAARTIKRCIDAVMDEQDAQWAKGVDDFDRFAVVSQAVSRFSVGLALLRAEEDTLEAQRIYQPKQKRKTRKSTKRRISSRHVKPTAVIVDEHNTARILVNPRLLIPAR